MIRISEVPIPRVDSLANIANHYVHCWNNIPKAFALQVGPINQLSPGFCVLEFAPTVKRSMWAYASCGMSNQSDATKLELHLFAPYRSGELIELITVIAHYHLTGDYLDLGHTVNFGRPWLPNSQCKYGFISLPYLDGPKLEWLTMDKDKIRFLWLIPINDEELEFKKLYGIERLEAKFEESNFAYADPFRASLA